MLRFCARIGEEQGLTRDDKSSHFWNSRSEACHKILSNEKAFSSSVLPNLGVIRGSYNWFKAFVSIPSDNTVRTHSTAEAGALVGSPFKTKINCSNPNAF